MKKRENEANGRQERSRNLTVSIKTSLSENGMMRMDLNSETPTYFETDVSRLLYFSYSDEDDVILDF